MASATSVMNRSLQSVGRYGDSIGRIAPETVIRGMNQKQNGIENGKTCFTLFNGSECSDMLANNIGLMRSGQTDA